MADDDARRELAPDGRLRVAINVANPALARPGDRGQDPTGIAVDLARACAEALHVELDLVPFDSAGRIVADDSWALAFLAIEPSRAASIAFTEPYLRIEGTYAVAETARFRSTADVDAHGVAVAVSAGAAYVPHLTRTLAHARIVTADTPGAAVELLGTGAVDATAGVRQALEDFAARSPGFRILPDRFVAIRQALGVPTDRPAGARFARDFVLGLHRSGRLLDLLAGHGQEQSIAPLTAG